MAAGAEVSLPEWMTKEYFVEVIAVKLSLAASAFTIVDLGARRATNAGDNYASVLYRVRVSVQVHDTDNLTDVSLIVKVQPKLGVSEAMMQMLDLFPKEMAMYAEVLPALERLYHERGRTDVLFGPRCFKHSTEPTSVLVLEDLGERRFKMANRCDGLSMEQTKFALRRLAQFHAASVVHHGRCGSYGDLFRDGMFTEKARAMHAHMQKGQAEMMQKIFASTPDIAENFMYYELMRHWGMDLFDALLRVTKHDPAKFNVLNHGDLWCNNILFHHQEDDNVDDVMLVDFQLSSWNSPAMDLLYFIFTSVNGDQKVSEINFMIQHYHEHLVESLKFLGHTGKLPLLRELHNDLMAYHLFGLTMCFGILPICLMEKTENASMDLMFDEGDEGFAFKKKMYTNPVYLKQMGEIMEYFYNMGAFDVQQLGIQRIARIECDALEQLPLWMDRELFEHIVDTKYGTGPTDKRRVRSVHIKNIAKKEDASVLYSATVDLFWEAANTGESLSLVVKAPPKGNVALYVRDKDLYVREQYLYEHLIPAFEALYTNRGVSVKLGPRFYKPRQVLPMEVLVLEDLGASGYRMANDQEGLDTAHTELVLDHLAKFHAASAVYCANGGKLPKELTEASSDKVMAGKTDERHAPTLDRLFECMKEWDFATDYIADLEPVSRQICALLVDTWTIDPDGFRVLNHGDVWAQNMLFSYDNDSVERVAMIDYQNSAWGSPAFDLIQFLFSSVKGELKLTRQAAFLRYYQERLADNLVLLGYAKPLPTLRQLHVAFNDRLSAAIKTTVIDLPRVLADSTEDVPSGAIVPQPEAAQSGPERRFENTRFKEQMKTLLPYFRSRGVLAELVANLQQH